MNFFREQILTLPGLIGDVIEPFSAETRRVFDESFCKKLKRLFTLGCGDSYFAALATELAFEMIAGIPTEPMNAMTFSRYAVEHISDFSEKSDMSAVIGISVSGGVTRTIEGVLRARKRGLRTFAVTSSDQTPIAQAADAVLTTKAPDTPNAAGVQVPGVRSYFASLMMLYLAALRIAEARGASVSEWRDKLKATADAAQRTIEMSDDLARELAEQTLDAKEFVFCGSGPNYATALFGAAKMLEATGDTAVGQDVEEWAHVQYFARAVDTPTFLISAGERDTSRAAEVKTAMQTIGRRVVEVDPKNTKKRSSEELNSDSSSLRSFVLNYAACPEVFAPLVAPIPLMLFASYRAELLGEPYFRAFGGGRSIEHGGGVSRIRTSEMVI
jgi:glucosamine--fructose-6-phosphate aminotransferase (isomerizing)